MPDESLVCAKAFGGSKYKMKLANSLDCLESGRVCAGERESDASGCSAKGLGDKLKTLYVYPGGGCHRCLPKASHYQSCVPERLMSL